MKKHIRKVDMFGYPVTLNMKKKNKHNSLIGGIFTIICIGIVSFLFFSGLNELLRK